MIFLQHLSVHSIVSFKSGDIILMLRYLAIEIFYSFTIIFIGAFQTEDAVNTSLTASMGAGEFLMRDRAIVFLYLNTSFVLRETS